MTDLLRTHRSLIFVLLAGLVIRAILIWRFCDSPLAVHDERDYDRLAENLVRYGEFALEPGELTSIRPPLYPAFLAAVYQVFGVQNHHAVRCLQAALALATTVVVYLLGKNLYDARTGVYAAAMHCFYPSLLGAGVLLLSETLFTFAIGLFLWLAIRYDDSSAWRHAILAGATLGLAALTRSVVWLFPPFAAIALVAFDRRRPWRQHVIPLFGFALAFAAPIIPWALRNSRLQETLVVVDVMGGRNFMMGNYEHTLEDRPWATIEVPGERAWNRMLEAKHGDLAGKSQGEIDRLAMGYALDYMSRHPKQTAIRAANKLSHMWQLEREIIAGARQGFWGEVGLRAVIALALVLNGSYVLIMVLGVLGIAAASPTGASKTALLISLISFVSLLHALSFGHSRYHLPLMPCIMLFAAGALTRRRELFLRSNAWRLVAAGVLIAALAYVWAGDIYRESSRLQNPRTPTNSNSDAVHPS